MKKFVYALFFAMLIFVFVPFQNTTFAQCEDVFQKNAFRIVKSDDENGRQFLSYIFPVNSQFFSDNFSAEEVAVYKFYLANYVGALAKTYSNKKLEKMTVSSCQYYSDIDGLGFSIMFENLQTQQQFFGNENNENEDKNTKNLITEGIFVKKTRFDTVFPIQTQKSAGDLKMICLLAISSWQKDCQIDENKKQMTVSEIDKANFIYDFSSSQNLLSSQNMYKTNNTIHNVFVKSFDEIESDNKIQFWICYVDKGMCYISAIIFVLFAMAISFVYLKIRKKL